MWFRRLTLIVVLSFVPWASTEGAFSFFEEVAGHLTLSYGGPDRAGVWRLVDAARDALLARCAPYPDCPVSDGIDVVEALLSDLNDPHTRLLSAVELALVARRIEGGSAAAFGVVLHAPSNGLGWVVLRTVVGSPAEAAGLTRGDRILRVDGLTPSARPEARPLTWAAAAADAQITALVLRSGAAPFQVDMVASEAPLDPLPRLTLLGDAGWLEIPSLVPQEAVTTAVHALVRAAQGAGVRRLIVDLRDDAGGSQLAAVAVAGAFVPTSIRSFTGPNLDLTFRFTAGTMVVHDQFGRTLERFAPIDAAAFTGEVVVLVNTRTASCAESLALALRDEAEAVTIGEATAGIADGVVTFVPLSGGMGLALTIGQVLDAHFTPIPHRLVPDVGVADDPMRLAAGIDAPLAAALALPWPDQ